MMVEKRKKAIIWAVLLSEGMHIFCCVLPTLFTVMSLLAGAGMITAMPGFVDDLHHVIHDYEVPMIVASGVILALGWGLHFYSRKLDCAEESACAHEPCGPRKNKLLLLMIAASVLFTVNVTVYMVFHRGAGGVIEVDYGHDDHHGHDH